MSDDGYNVSKSIFYTPIISNEVPTQRKIKHIKQHFHVIESKILPSGISEILPNRSREEKDESDFWIDKFNTELEEKDLLPKWAKRHLQKYRKGESSSED